MVAALTNMANVTSCEKANTNSARASKCQQGPVPRKMVKFNPGLSQILSKVFLSDKMQLKFTK